MVAGIAKRSEALCARHSTQQSVFSKACLRFEEAFGAVPSITDARKRAENYLIQRRLLRRLSNGDVIDPLWTQFAFPTLWHYDVLRGAGLHARAPRVPPDPRMKRSQSRSSANARERWPLAPASCGVATRFTKRWPARRRAESLDHVCARECGGLRHSGSQ
jgi:hypothetical protein